MHRSGRWMVGAVVMSATMAGSSAAVAEGLEEIIVTAQKREQRFQDVPVAVSAFTPAFLEQNNVTDFGELSLYTPGFVSSPNYSYHIYSAIRGISSTDFGFGTDPSIGFYLNGVHLGRYGTQVVSYYDIDSVEVLKGPQNTLFGRSSIAGAISVTTKRPTQQFESYVDVGVGNLDHKELTGVVNVPVSDTFAVRAAGTYNDRDGYLDNTFGGDKIGASEVGAARLSGRFTGIEGLDADLVLNYEDRKETGNVYAAVGLPDFTVSSTLRGRQNKSDFIVKDALLDLSYAFSDTLSLKSLTNYRKVNADYAEDYDALEVVVGGPYYQGQDVDLFNQELRLQYTRPDGLAVIVGASYFDESMTAFVDEWVDTQFAFTGTYSPDLVPGSYADAFVERGEYDSGAKGWSVFADATVPVTDRFSVTAGLRYNNDKKDMTIFIPDPATLPDNANAPFPCGCYLYGLYTSAPLSLDRSWNDTSGRLALSYKLTDDVTTYLSWSQGWKAGGIESFKFDLPAGFPLYFGQDLTAAGGGLRSYDPEKSDSYEGGIKGYVGDHRFRFDVALYHYTYKDLQKSVFNGATAVIENIGKAKGQGIETDLRFVPTENWDLFLNSAYTDTEILDDPNPQQEGLPLNRAPKFTYAAGATYSFAVSWSEGARMSLNLTHSHTDKYRTDNSLQYGVRAYDLTNINIDYDSGGRYSIHAYVDNVDDKFTYNRRLYATPFVFPVESRSVIGNPRQYGVNFRYKFGQ